MYMSVTVLALSGFFVGTMPVSPAWQGDYDLARKLGRDGRKPLAVFIASGKSGWNHLSKEGNLGTETNRVLAAEYVCVYLDTNQSAAKRLATAFEIPDGTGLILSDRTGGVQAFRHEGDLRNQDLNRYLTRYSDPQRVVTTTESNPGDDPPPRYSRPEYSVRPASYSTFSVGRSC